MPVKGGNNIRTTREQTAKKPEDRTVVFNFKFILLSINRGCSILDGYSDIV